MPTANFTSYNATAGDFILSAEFNAFLAYLTTIINGLDEDNVAAGGFGAAFHGDLRAITDIALVGHIASTVAITDPTSIITATNVDDALTEIFSDFAAYVVSNGSDISALQSDMTAAQSDITALQSDMTAAQSDISALQSDVSALQGLSIVKYVGYKYHATNSTDCSVTVPANTATTAIRVTVKYEQDCATTGADPQVYVPLEIKQGAAAWANLSTSGSPNPEFHSRIFYEYNAGGASDRRIITMQASYVIDATSLPGIDFTEANIIRIGDRWGTYATDGCSKFFVEVTCV